MTKIRILIDCSDRQPTAEGHYQTTNQYDVELRRYWTGTMWATCKGVKVVSWWEEQDKDFYDLSKMKEGWDATNKYTVVGKYPNGENKIETYKSIYDYIEKQKLKAND
jgi:hypothetical protein